MPNSMRIVAALSRMVYERHAKRFVLASILLFSWIMLSVAVAWSQSPPLSFENNYFVTGDYVVGGVGLRGLGVNGFATGTINIGNGMDTIYPSPSVPAGADIVGAFLYWQTVESSQTSYQGQNGYFKATFSQGAPANGYPITGVVLGNPNAPVSWSSGGCTGSSHGSKTMRTYRADVRSLLSMNANGTVQANGSYQVTLADSGSNGGTTPLTLGATLVIIYRVLDMNVPLNAIVLYDGSYAPSNNSSTMSQAMQGFYQPADTPRAKLTHIVGNGQSNKYEQVLLGNYALTPGNTAAFPGAYSGSWDNPTYDVSQYVGASDTSETTSVVPSNSNSGCVSWGAIVLSTTVKDTDNDGLLDVWEQNQGYCDATDASGSCDSTHTSWVPLPGANPNQKDVYVQMDYLQCSSGDTACGSPHSHQPPAAALTLMTSMYAGHGVNLHLISGKAIEEQPCVDNPNGSPAMYCSFPNQPGAVGWKGGLEFLKNSGTNGSGQLLDPASCALDSSCVRRFQYGRKDSYHYALFGHSLGMPGWSFLAGTLQSIGISGTTLTFTTTVPHGLVVSATAANGRVTVGDAVSNYGLNGVYFVQSTPSPTTFTAQLNQSVAPATFSLATDPFLSVTSGQVRSGSGYSDIGGADSLITLGLWGPDGQSLNAQAGTFTHELGHSVALTHGGYYYDQQGTYIPTVEANCKPNYQSVMNYLFQVDLLGPNGVLDYSGQQLIPLNEQALSGVNQLTTTGGQATTYSTTEFYGSTPPHGIGTPATRHCDGTLLLQSDPQMFRLDGATTGLTWSNNQDINFNGQADTSLRGFNDWGAIDFRQIGATGSDVTGGVGSIGFGAGTPGFGAGTPGFGAGTPGFGAGTPGFGAGEGAGQGAGEITFETANSSVRSPRSLTATQTPPPRYIQLNWFAPTFGQIGSYNIYRSTNGATAVLISSVLGTSLRFTDTAVTCGSTYSYFVTAVLANTNPPQESVPSNTTSAIPTCTPTSTTVTSSVNPSIFGQSVTFTATVANTSGDTATPTGSVQFSVDGASFGAALPLSGSGAAATGTSSATATLTVSGSPHTIKAVYTNTDGDFTGSSGTLGQTVNPAPTSTTVTSSVNPSIYGQSVTFTATVANIAGAGISTATPTGSVQFMDGTSLLGTPQTVSGLGTATLTASALTVGTHPITAVYTNIDGNFRGSTSTSVTQVVQDFSITATPNAQTISSGHQAIYSITVTPIGGLTGTIALSCSGAPPNSTCSVSPSTANLQGTAVASTVTLSANKNVNHGTFALTFTGAPVGSNLTHSTTVQLTVK